MVGIDIWCEIVCRSCAEAHFGQMVSSNRIPKREIIKAAKNGGWTFVGQDPYCGSCTEIRESSHD